MLVPVSREFQNIKVTKELVSVPIYGLFINNSTEAIVVFMGTIKVVISFVKYIPQVYLNWSRKSTEGWSLENVMLDLMGGTLTFLQILLDYADSGDMGNQFGSGLNTAKFLLGVLTIIFDLIFLFQHYVLYNPKNRRPLHEEEHEEDEEQDATDEIESKLNSIIVPSLI